MKHHFNTSNLLFLLIFSLISPVLSIAQNRQIIPEPLKSVEIVRDANDLPRHISYPENAQPTLENALAFLNSALKTNTHYTLREIGRSTDAQGNVHYTYQQFLNGLPVEDGLFKIHSQKGRVSSMNGNLKMVKTDLPATAAVSESAAFNKALQVVKAQKYAWELSEKESKDAVPTVPKGQLTYKVVENSTDRDKNGTLVLVYRFQIEAIEPYSHDKIYIDATTAQLVARNTIICNEKHEHGNGHNKLIPASAATRKSGNRTIQTTNYSIWPFYFAFQLTDPTRGGSIEIRRPDDAFPYTDNDNNWTAAEHRNSIKTDAAIEALWATEMTYDYFLSRHGRNSFNGAGAKVVVQPNIRNWENASWNGSALSFGFGDDLVNDSWVTLDIVAHEFGHAVCQYSCNLQYQGESGALNEAFSDIWGACVEAWAAPNKNRWAIGEEIFIAPGNMLRSMSEPNLRSQPDTYKGDLWVDPTIAWDNGGVHMNSGILNHWFFLLTEGRAGRNDKGHDFQVHGIGMDKTARIAYLLETEYLTATSTYTDAAFGALQAAQRLFGVTSNEYIQCWNALYAVGLVRPYATNEYCFADGNSTQYEFIQGVLGGFYYTSGNNFGYGDFTQATYFKTKKGTTMTLGLLPGFTSDPYNERWRIWIDFNQDQDFDDAGETIDAGSGTGYLIASIAVPATAKQGPTRMRIAMSFAGDPVPSPCSVIQNGEVEDYTLIIDNNYCAPAGNLGNYEWIRSVVIGSETNNSGASSYSNFSEKVVPITIGSPTGILAMQGHAGGPFNENWRVWIDLNRDGDFSDAGELMASANNAQLIWTTFTVPAGVASGYTTLRVAMAFGTTPAECMNGVHGEIEDYTVRLVNRYCSPTLSAALGFIRRVTLNDMTNFSNNDSGYRNYTEHSARLQAGSANTITLQPGFPTSITFAQNWAVYVDWNRDGIFAHPFERVSTATGAGTRSATLSVSATQPGGEYRMRVVMSNATVTGPCQATGFGEAEDYTLVVNNPVSGFDGINERDLTDDKIAQENTLRRQGSDIQEMPEWRFWPNPTTGFVNINGYWSDEERVGIRVINATGQIVEEIQVSDPASGQQQIDLSHLPNGLYMLRLDCSKGQSVKQLVIQR